MVPAREVGGDYYDYFRVSDDLLGLLVGDVSGKGAPAAMVMTMCKGIFSAVVAEEISPGRACTRANEILHREISADRFVTDVMWPLYLVLLFAVEIHAALGMYRLAIK